MKTKNIVDKDKELEIKRLVLRNKYETIKLLLNQPLAEQAMPLITLAFVEVITRTIHAQPDCNITIPPIAEEAYKACSNNMRKVIKKTSVDNKIKSPLATAIDFEKKDPDTNVFAIMLESDLRKPCTLKLLNELTIRLENGEKTRVAPVILTINYDYDEKVMGPSFGTERPFLAFYERFASQFPKISGDVSKVDMKMTKELAQSWFENQYKSDIKKLNLTPFINE